MLCLPNFYYASLLECRDRQIRAWNGGLWEITLRMGIRLSIKPCQKRIPSPSFPLISQPFIINLMEWGSCQILQHKLFIFHYNLQPTVHDFCSLEMGQKLPVCFFWLCTKDHKVLGYIVTKGVGCKRTNEPSNWKCYDFYDQWHYCNLKVWLGGKIQAVSKAFN